MSRAIDGAGAAVSGSIIDVIGESSWEWERSMKPPRLCNSGRLRNQTGFTNYNVLNGNKRALILKTLIILVFITTIIKNNIKII